MPAGAGQTSQVQTCARKIAKKNGLESKPIFTKLLGCPLQTCTSLTAGIVACSPFLKPQTVREPESMHAPWCALTLRTHCQPSFGFILPCWDAAERGNRQWKQLAHRRWSSTNLNRCRTEYCK